MKTDLHIVTSVLLKIKWIRKDINLNIYTDIQYCNTFNKKNSSQKLGFPSEGSSPCREQK